jgi:hypothetical protein
MFDLKGFLLGWVLVGIFLGTYFFVFSPRAKVHAALETVAGCVDKENDVVCARPSIKEMLSFLDGGEIMQVLSQRLDPRQCHYFGHVVGQQLYVKDGTVERSIDQCNRLCDSACIHGVIGAAFAEGLGNDNPETDIDLAHLSPDEVAKVGKKLCSEPELCHGVGHSIFQAYGAFKPALDMCRQAAPPERRSYCYHGLFMEYADIISSRNMQTISGIEMPTFEEVIKICNLSAFDQRRSCFRYFPRMVITVLTENRFSPSRAITRFKEICDTFPVLDDRVACVAGFGVYSSYSVVRDPESAVRICEAFDSKIDKAACHVGQISVATQDRQSAVIKYCSFIPNQELQKSCYQGIFFYLNRLATPKEEAFALCGGNSLCEAETKRVEIDPWFLLQKEHKE